MGTGGSAGRSWRATVVALLLTTTLVALVPGRAEAATLELLVTTTLDTVDPDDGLLSLREAVDRVNDHDGPAIITLLEGTYQLTLCNGGFDGNRNGMLEVADKFPGAPSVLTIHGAGSTIDQTCEDRPHIFPHGGYGPRPLNIDHLTFVNGKWGALYLVSPSHLDDVRVLDTKSEAGFCTSSQSGAIVLESSVSDEPSTFTDLEVARTTDGTGILHHAVDPLILNRVELTDNDNRAGGDSPECGGGGLAATGSVTITDSVVSGNHGPLAGGISMTHHRRLDLVRTRIEDNTGLMGGIISYDEVSAEDSTIVGNHSVGDGSDPEVGVGGLAAEGVSLVRTTIAGNEGATGGMLANGTVRDSTIAGNTGSVIGGIDVLGFCQGCGMELHNATVADNVGGEAGGVGSIDGGSSSSLDVAWSTIASNRATDPTGGDQLVIETGAVTRVIGTTAIGNGGASPAPDCRLNGAAVTSLGHNVASDGSCGLGAGPGDVVNAGDLGLQPLAAFGSSAVPVRLPGVGSPLRERIPAGVDGCPGTDARGRTRPQGNICDVGAAEGVGGGLHPLASPVRAADTRTGGGKLAAGESRVFDLSSHLPAGTQAVAVNLTIVGPSTATHLTAYPDGQPRPHVSNINAAAGQTIANNAIVPVGPGGKIRVFNNAGTAHVVVDLTGTFDNGAAVDGTDCPCGAAYVSLANPQRALDTRTLHAPLGPGGQRTLKLTDAFAVPVDATAVALNLTITGATAASHLTAWPAGQALPSVSNLNWPAGDTIANAAIVLLGTDGSITLRNNSGNVHVIVDVIGWYRPGTGNRYHAIHPTRVLDTRPSAPLVAGSPRTVTLPTSVAPGAVTALAANLTAINPSLATHLTAWPADHPLPPTSTLNLRAGDTRPNLTQNRVGLGNGIRLQTNSGTTHAALDVQGWYV